MGNFEKCLLLIASFEQPQLVWIKDALKKECLTKNKRVFQLNNSNLT